uniref:Spaetzle domain-containing protein n=1 Tax=Heliothis virescens TaxID=7102 RepID=A0A2A4JY32_HELVI
MSYDRLVLIAAVLIVALAYVLARPQEFVLSDVANKTMCPIEVEINDNPERIPRRIKFLKCAARPNKLCSEHHISHGCCKQHHHAFVTECVEIYDWVQVTFKSSEAPKTIKVPVGCTCLIEETTVATEVP